MCVIVHEKADSDRLVAHHERFHHLLHQHFDFGCDGMGWRYHVVRVDHSRRALRRVLDFDVPKSEDNEMHEKPGRGSLYVVSENQKLRHRQPAAVRH